MIAEGYGDGGGSKIICAVSYVLSAFCFLFFILCFSCCALMWWCVLGDERECDLHTTFLVFLFPVGAQAGTF